MRKKGCANLLKVREAVISQVGKDRKKCFCLLLSSSKMLLKLQDKKKQEKSFKTVCDMKYV